MQKHVNVFESPESISSTSSRLVGKTALQPKNPEVLKGWDFAVGNRDVHDRNQVMTTNSHRLGHPKALLMTSLLPSLKFLLRNLHPAYPAACGSNIW